jgi:hypothetical protein
LYKSTGFVSVGITSPGYFYYKNSVRLSRQQCQKHKLNKIFGAEYDAKQSETYNMLSNGYIKVYDAGHEKLIYKDGNIELYSETNIYYKPFIYYSQAHIVGIDIKQDLYPNMNGLCIINDISEYTTVAQSMCRLRKLNMGHVITFLYLGKINNVNELLDKINTNEKTTKEFKYDSLIYQTLKSEIRKKLPYDNKDMFLENYIEDKSKTIQQYQTVLLFISYYMELYFCYSHFWYQLFQNLILVLLIFCL